MKSSEGRHYRKFSQEHGVLWGMHFPGIVVTFWSSGVLLATFGETPCAGPHFRQLFRGFLMHLGASGGALEHDVEPIGRHCAARGLNCDVFLMTSARNLVFRQSRVAKREQKRRISREGDVFKT